MTLPNIIEYTEPVKLFFKRKWHEYDDVYTFQFKSEEKLPYRAGQNARIVIPDLGGEEGKRSLSFASIPSDEYVQFSMHTKSGSGFKKALLNLQKGDIVHLVKIKGLTTLPEDPKIPIVCIAGGVGVVPFRSLLLASHAERPAASAVLVHVSRDSYLYENELVPLPYEQYRICRDDTERVILEVCHKFKDAQYYIAGSPLFIESITTFLTSHRIPEDRVLAAKFKGYEEELD